MDPRLPRPKVIGNYRIRRIEDFMAYPYVVELSTKRFFWFRQWKYVASFEDFFEAYEWAYAKSISS